MSLTARIFKERRNVILPLIVFLVANVAALGAVAWLERDAAGAMLVQQEADLDLATAKQLESSAKDQKTRKDRAETELRKFYTEILPKDFSGARDITNFWLGRIADRSNLRWRAGVFDAAPVRDSQLMKFTAEVTLVGEYADIRRFLYEVETSEEFIIVEKVALSQPNATQGGGQLEVALSVSTYFMSDPRTSGVSR